MADKTGHITTELRFGGNIRLSPPTSNYGKVRDPEAGERRHRIEEIEEQRVSDKKNAEVWD